MRNLLSSFLALMVSCIICNAETIKRTDKFTSFTGIRISDDFEVEITEGTGYNVRLSLDARAADYCRVFLQGSLLVIEVDEKAYPRELKSQLRRKGATPLKFEAVVTVPRNGIIQNIILEDNAILSCRSKFDVARSITISASRNAVIRNLNVKASEVEMLATNKSSIQGRINADNILLKGLNSSSYIVDLAGNSARICMEASGKASLNTSLNELAVIQSGSSNVNIQGRAKIMSLQNRNSSSTDARNAAVNEIIVEMQGSAATLTGKDRLTLKDLSAGAKLSYSGTPAIVIGRIVSSSVECTEIDKSGNN